MRYLIVGFGNIGKKRAAALGKKFKASYDPNPKVNADFKKLKDIPKQIYDAAVLTVPQQFKFELTKQFLSLGKHVLNEKPFIATKKQLGELKKIGQKNNVIFHTSYNHRFEPNVIRFQKLIASGFLGKIYHGRFVYSFGNIKERIGTWRETRFGVLEEIAPHLLDFLISFFGYKGKDFLPLISAKNETKIFDHFTFITSDKKIVIETSSITWKNQFLLEVFGSRGSLHLTGLRKWGGSKLIKRTRVLPSGSPKEQYLEDSGPDLTWKRDFKFFEKMVREKRSSFKNDFEMSLALAKITKGGNKIYAEINNG